MQLRHKVYKLVKNCDFYGIDVSLNYRKHKSYRSFYGGVWSIMVASVIIVLCVQQFLDSILYLSPQIKQYTQYGDNLLQKFLESEVNNLTVIYVDNQSSNIQKQSVYYSQMSESVKILIPLIYEDIYDVDSPLKKKQYLEIQKPSSFHHTLLITIQMEMIYYQTDSGLLWEMNSDVYSFTPTNVDTSYVSSNTTDLRVEFKVNPIFKRVDRGYKRIHQVLSLVGGLVKFLMLLGNFLSKPITKLKFQISFLNQFFNFNQIDKAQKTFYPLNSQAISQKILKISKPELQKQPTKVIKSILKRYSHQQHQDVQTDRPDEDAMDEDVNSQEVDDLIEKYFQPQDSKLKLQHFQYVKYFFGFTGQMKRRIKQLRLSLEMVNQKTDIINVFNKLQEVEKLKQILLNEDQLNLFEYIPKPNINLQLRAKEPKLNPIQKATQAYRSFQQINEKQVKSHIDIALMRMIDGNIKKFFVVSSGCISFARSNQNQRSSYASPQQHNTEHSRSENLKNEEVNEQ